MCGIFFYSGRFKFYVKDKVLTKEFEKIQHRGPDNSTSVVVSLDNNDLYLGFHRLSVNGLNKESNQPLINENVYLICNGEIFNYKELIEEYDINDYKTDSDCEIIIHLYKKLGFNEMIKKLDGEFAFVLVDKDTGKIYISRDHLGIRSLFIGWKGDEFIVSSEMKSIDETYKVEQFKPRTYMVVNEKNEIIENNEYFTFEKRDDKYTEEEHIENIKRLMDKAVKKRLMSDRNICCLLSGGLDSTIVTGIVSKYFKPYTLNTYSIGLKGSVDVKYSKIAGDYFKTNHTVIELTNEDFINAIENTIYQIESYDVTTVRASIGNYLVSCYIRDNSEDKVVFCGDVADEIFGSYRGFYYVPDDDTFYHENMKMLQNIHYFDVLRSDKSISGAGLEARVPFSDKDLISYVMNMDPKYKRFDKDKIEKYILRKAHDDLLPKKLCWRVKTAFSDGVSNEKNPFYEILNKHFECKYSEEEYTRLRDKYVMNPPYDKESLYYREVFEKHFKNKDYVIPYFWKQPCMREEDPSAWLAEKTEKKKKLHKKSAI